MAAATGPGAPAALRPGGLARGAERPHQVRPRASVTNVGSHVVTPVAASAAPARARSAGSAARASTPANPLTWRSTNPGAARPAAPGPGASPAAATRPSSRLARRRDTSSPPTSAWRTPSRVALTRSG